MPRTMKPSEISVPALWSLNNDCLHRILSFCELEDQWACSKTCTILWRAVTAVKWRDTVQTIGPLSSWMQDLAEVVYLVPRSSATKAILCDLQRISTEILKASQAGDGQKSSFEENFRRYASIQHFHKLYEHDLQTKWARNPLVFDGFDNLTFERVPGRISAVVPVEKFLADVLVGCFLQRFTVDCLFRGVSRYQPKGEAVPFDNMYTSALRFHMNYLSVSCGKKCPTVQPVLFVLMEIIKREDAPSGQGIRSRNHILQTYSILHEWPSQEVSNLQGVLEKNNCFRQMVSEASMSQAGAVSNAVVRVSLFSEVRLRRH